MKTSQTVTLLAGLAIALVAGAPISVFAHEKPARQPNVVAVTGQSDWSLVPPAIPSEYVTFHDDGGLTIQRMPLAGVFAIAGDGTTIEATIKGELNADLDPTLSGPIYGPVVITQNVRGKDVVIFEGHFFGRVESLLASGQMLLHGRGRQSGTTIAVSLLETGANTEIFVLTGHLFDPNGD